MPVVYFPFSVASMQLQESGNPPSYPALTDMHQLKDDGWYSSADLSQQQFDWLATFGGRFSLRPPKLYNWQGARGHGWAIRVVQGKAVSGPYTKTLKIWSSYENPTHLEIDDSKSIADWIGYAMGDLAGVVQTELATLNPGEYYPRIWRGIGSPSLAESGFKEHAIEANRVRRMLEERLRHLFAVVQPATAHLSVYGHAVRELLMLACTEAESAMQAVMVEQRASPKGKHFTRNDYVRLATPMRLMDYELRLISCPGLGSFRPFRAWPGSALSWYTDYNDTKHSRETALHKATIAATIEAVAACHVLLLAQYGAEAAQLEGGSDAFMVTSWPKFAPADRYVPADLDWFGGTPIAIGCRALLNPL